ncbi:MAG: UDP-N-acetylmuramate--L-alanine ligase, partial [Bacteroidales bacterium]|nr:UDP-N-acetylmuramate--L-alanine ligase [Bacteroidales bacterium]
GRKLTAIFQPHLYTRTRDFAPDFARALSLCDEVVLLDIYPAREEPIPGVTSEIIFNEVTSPEKTLLKYNELLSWVDCHDVNVLVTFGAGNIDRLVEPIAEILRKRV